ncbi:MAG: hypothetical protein NTZ25_05045 [Candidatus Peregrinibacteria bacterium]|nr:hypothetical protein [Candidatus Peregrinibacteria bacterium]
MKRVSFLLYLGAAVLLVVVIYTGYAFWQRSSTADQVAVLDKSISEYQAKINEKENAQITQAINAKQTVNDLKKGTVEWSKVITYIRATVPKSGVSPIAEILSYSGSSSNEISLNMKTYSSSESPYLDVAAVIKSFTDSKMFVDVFVPSISSGADASGKDVLSFMLSAKYVPQTDEPNLNDTLSTVLDKGLEDKTVKTDEKPVAPVEAASPIAR